MKRVLSSFAVAAMIIATAACTSGGSIEKLDMATQINMTHYEH